MDDAFNGFESELRPGEKILWEGEAKKKSSVGPLIAGIIIAIVATAFIKLFLLFSIVGYLIAGLVIAATIRSMVKGVEYRDRFAVTDMRAIVYYTAVRSFVSANYRDVKSIKERRMGKSYSVTIETEETLVTMNNIQCDDVEFEILLGYLNDAESRRNASAIFTESAPASVSADDFFSQSIPENYMESFSQMTSEEKAPAVSEKFTAESGSAPIPEALWTAEVRNAIRYVKRVSYSENDREVYAMGSYKEKFGGMEIGLIIISAVIAYLFLLPVFRQMNGIESTLLHLGITLAAAAGMTAMCLSMTGKHTYVVTNAHVILYKGMMRTGNLWLKINSDTEASAESDSVTIRSKEIVAVRKSHYKKHGEVQFLMIDGLSPAQTEEVVSAVNTAARKLW